MNRLAGNQSGISLVSVMIAAGLMGGLSLAMMKIMNNMSSGHVLMEALADEEDLKSNIQMLLENKKHCTVSLKDSIFKKQNVDFGNNPVSRATASFDSSSEGLDISLWYSDAEGLNKTQKRFNGADNAGTQDQSSYGKLKIKTMKLIMNNGAGTCSGNYCEGDLSDVGQIAVLYEKPIGPGKYRENKMVFDVNVKMNTNASGDSMIDSCALKLENENGGNFDYPQACSIGFRYATHGGHVRNSMTMPLNKPGFYGIKLIGDSDMDGDNYFHLKANCPASGGNEFDDYLRQKCYLAFGQRDSASNTNSQNAYPERHSSRKFNTVGSWENFNITGDVNEDDRFYYKLYCNSGYGNQDLVDWVGSTCRLCMGHTDRDSDRNVRNVSCNPVQTSGASTTSGWGQVMIDDKSDVGPDDTFFFGLFCNNHYFPDVIDSDITP